MVRRVGFGGCVRWVFFVVGIVRCVWSGHLATLRRRMLSAVWLGCRRRFTTLRSERGHWVTALQRCVPSTVLLAQRYGGLRTCYKVLGTQVAARLRGCSVALHLYARGGVVVVKHSGSGSGVGVLMGLWIRGLW